MGDRLRYAALLRAIANLPMKPLRDALEELGFTNVESYATSGNLLFDAPDTGRRSLERRITERLGTDAFVRTRAEMARVVAGDPLLGIVMFLGRPPTAARRRVFLELDFEDPHPVLRGTTLYYSYPLLLRGRRTPFDIERALGVRGTFRTSRVAAILLDRLSAPPAGSAADVSLRR
ncbi:MAG TPA: DUF1697 domain-containing protein [Actinomycetota bacterium]|nr:DUF1697 domain-containing protein [Actinomycetota bacterium]